MKKVTVRIKGGKVYFETDGVTGPECKDLTRELEEAVGEVEEEHLKEDYDQVALDLLTINY